MPGTANQKVPLSLGLQQPRHRTPPHPHLDVSLPKSGEKWGDWRKGDSGEEGGGGGGPPGSMAGVGFRQVQSQKINQRASPPSLLLLPPTRPMWATGKNKKHKQNHTISQKSQFLLLPILDKCIIELEFNSFIYHLFVCLLIFYWLTF